MGTAGFLRSGYAVIWLLLLLALGVGVWWLMFNAQPPASLGAVKSEDIKTEALGPAETEPATPVERPEPSRAYLEEAELSLASPDGATLLEVIATQAEKEDSRYRLKEGRINFTRDSQERIELTVTDGTYHVTSGVAYIEGTLRGRIAGTSQSFEARRLQWNQTSNIVLAEAVILQGSNFAVSGERMSIQLPEGLIEFQGPVRAQLTGAL